MVDVGAVHLGEGEGGGVGNQDLVLGADVALDLVGEVALDLGGERVPRPEVAEEVDLCSDT